MNSDNKILYSDLTEIFNEKIFRNIDLEISQYLKDHLLQRICQQFYFPIIYGKNGSDHTKNDIDLQKIMNQFGLRYVNRELHLTYYKQLKLFIKLISYLVYSVSYLTFTKKLKSQNKMHLIYGLSKEHIYLNSKKINCIDFFNKVNPHWRTPDIQILVELKNPLFFFEKSKQNFRIVFDISLYMLRHQFTNKFKLFFKFIIGFFFVLNLSRKNSVILLIGKEVLSSYMFNFKLPKIESLSTTVSQNLIQPPMFHYFQETPKYMYWYSNNSIPIYNSKSNKIEGDLSYLKYAKIDKHYVWTKDFGNLIRKISGKKFQVCNPILFYNSTIAYPSKDIGILIFDVIPFKRYNDVSYYSERNCMKFIDDIVKVHKAIGSNYDIGPLILKPKREFIRAHSKTYAKQIKALNKLGVIKLENCNVNLLDLISRTKIVICMPLSSPALIAHRLGVPTCYYNPNSDFFFSRFNYGIKVIDSAEGLEFFCKTVLG